MVAHCSLQTLLLDKLVNIAFVLLVYFFEAVELLFLKHNKVLFLLQRIIFRDAEVFTIRAEAMISDFEGIVADVVFI